MGRATRCFKSGHKIGLVIDGEFYEGTVFSTDTGDWIYPSFPKATGYKPSWCRSTQVIDLEE